MRHLYLKFTSRTAWQAVQVEPDETLHVVELGRIADPTDAIGEDGSTVMKLRPGWHIDLICEDDRDLSAFDPFMTHPATPRHVIA